MNLPDTSSFFKNSGWECPRCKPVETKTSYSSTCYDQIDKQTHNENKG